MKNERPKIRFLFFTFYFLLFSFITLFGTQGASSAPIFKAIIREVDYQNRALIVLLEGDLGVEKVIVHPQALLIKGGSHVKLDNFKATDRIVILPSGSLKVSPLVAIGIQDEGSFQQSSAPLLPDSSFTPTVLKPESDSPFGDYYDLSGYPDPWQELDPRLGELLKNTVTSAPPSLTSSGDILKQDYSFGEGEGEIKEIDFNKKIILLQVAPSQQVIKVRVSQKTKIYRFYNNDFTFLSLEQLKIGLRIRVSGFRDKEGISATMILVMSLDTN